ncbi:hypothetical protein [Vagococcus fessus]|uniref:Uncharacterized protein n=1 Tax=Vagococcus fessus TaxID=120370 RepID=A0A430A8R9_9ENTE|nr:hypothetical protein [Vagococcus fessus]RSU03513.1 hypothetical protein CBF31_07315 [Vagococcus fessus]
MPLTDDVLSITGDGISFKEKTTTFPHTLGHLLELHATIENLITESLADSSATEFYSLYKFSLPSEDILNYQHYVTLYFKAT